MTEKSAVYNTKSARRRSLLGAPVILPNHWEVRHTVKHREHDHQNKQRGEQSFLHFNLLIHTLKITDICIKLNGTMVLMQKTPNIGLLYSSDAISQGVL